MRLGSGSHPRGSAARRSRPARLAGWCAPLLLACTLSACATKSDVRELRTFMRAEMATFRDSVQAEIASMQTQLDRLEAGQKELILGRSSELERRIAGLRAQLDQLTALVAQTQQQMDRQIELLARGAPAGTTGGAGADTAGGGPVPRAQGDVGELYQAAREQMQRGAHGTAREAFAQIVTQHPDHELAPDAQFYLAQTFQQEGDLERALQEFTAIMQLYPNSQRAPASLYQRARIQLERGNTSEGRTLLQRIIRGYPDSPEARRAAQQLEEIGQG